MPKRVATGGFGKSGAADRDFDGVLQVLFADVMAAQAGAARVGRELRCGKDILPTPIAGGIAVLAGEGEGKVNRVVPTGEILAMKLANSRSLGWAIGGVGGTIIGKRRDNYG